MNVFLGIDLGSVSTNLVLLNEEAELIDSIYLRTGGRPIQAIQEGLRVLGGRHLGGLQVLGAGTTGSGRRLAALVIGADVAKNEITAHAVASLREVPGVRTIMEIGGQDSKIIILRDGVVVDFAMNTVCAAGTGSFLDHQAARMNIPIEEFGERALRSTSPTRIAGRCSVFAESDMIHKQQMGHKVEDIIAGLCEALVRNYLNNVAKGKDIRPPVVFQGGVAANAGIRAAFEKALQVPVIVPHRFDVMGAIGAALLAQETVADGRPSQFKGFDVGIRDYVTNSFVCQDCPNHCEVVQVIEEGEVVGRWGDRCGKWSASVTVPTRPKVPHWVEGAI
ncbi:MAG: acyl-CoA dehydratase activase [Limnochordia bacterium]|nr:2-hydroxyglutaryl-CoA dehydratase [Bacillota bacterium]